jgi:two-component system response regulator FixJ
MTAPGGKRVYVIDDDAGVLESTAFLLSVLGYECVGFPGAEPFLEAAGTLAPACIITDLRMPGLSGFELAEALRRRGIGWPILLMTSEHGASLEERAAQQGFAALLHKPVDADRLAGAVALAVAAFER